MHKENKRLWPVVLASFGILLSGCNHTVMPDTPAAQFGLRVWTAERCPSVPPPLPLEIPAALVPLADVFLGTLIEAGVESISNALTEAARADREGTAVKGSSAAYLFVARNTGVAKVQPLTAECVILALSNVQEPVQYCSPDASLPAPLSKACAHGKDVLKHLNCHYVSGSAAESAPRCAPPTTAVSDLPQIYAEIALVRATDHTGVKPDLVNLYYAAALDPGRSTPERDLAISVEIATPDGKSAGNFLLTLRNVVPTDDPGHTYDHQEWDGLWMVMPDYSGRTLVEADAGLKVGAVNLSAEIRETGKLNKFLQAFAGAVEKDKADYKKAISEAALSSKREEASVEGQKGQAAVDKAAAAAQKAVVDFLKACAKTDYASDEVKTADLERLRSLVSSAYASLRAVEIENRVSATISAAPDSCP